MSQHIAFLCCLSQEAKEISVTQVNTFTKPVVLKCKEVSTFMENLGREGGGIYAGNLNMIVCHSPCVLVNHLYTIYFPGN